MQWKGVWSEESGEGEGLHWGWTTASHPQVTAGHELRNNYEKLLCHFNYATRKIPENTLGIKNSEYGHADISKHTYSESQMYWRTFNISVCLNISIEAVKIEKL